VIAVEGLFFSPSTVEAFGGGAKIYWRVTAGGGSRWCGGRVVEALVPRGVAGEGRGWGTREGGCREIPMSLCLCICVLFARGGGGFARERREAREIVCVGGEGRGEMTNQGADFTMLSGCVCVCVCVFVRTFTYTPTRVHKHIHIIVQKERQSHCMIACTYRHM
jgi:hypothetical protein